MDSRRVLRKSILAISIVFKSQIVVLNPASAGLIDCVKASKWANAKSLKSAFLKAPEKKSPADWFDAYILARVFTGYPNCFNKKDVAVMNDYVTYMNNYCITNPNWNNLCYIAKSKSKLADWLYSNYK